MSLLLDCTIKVSLVIAIGLAGRRLFGRRSAALRHCVLACSLACAAAVPALALVVPSWSLPPGVALVQVRSATTGTGAGAVDTGIELRLPVQGGGQDAAASSGRPAGARGGSGLVWPGEASQVVLPLWLAGAGGTLLFLVIGLARLAWLASRSRRLTHGPWADQAQDISRQYRLRRPVRLLLTPHPTLLVTCGFLRPSVLLPAGADRWGSDRIRVVLAHELAHVARGDWAVQMGARTLCAVHWFNPLVWLATRRVSRESEHACDDAVMSQGIEGSEYATHLLELARAFRGRRSTWWPAPAIVRPSSLERRVSTMLNAHADRTPASRRIVTAAAVALLSLTVPIAGFQAFAQTFSTLSGSVSDPQGGLVPSATLTLTNSGSGSKYEVRSDGSGRYEFVGLPAADYVLAVELPGFRMFKDAVTVAGGDVERNITLQMGTVTETVVVAGAAAGAAAGGGRMTAAAGDDRDRFERAVEECRASSVTVPPGGGGRVRPPRKIKHVSPEYPESLRSGGVGGLVKLEARIGIDGRVSEAQPVDPSAPADLVAAAIDAVREWQFEPTLLNCAPVDVSMLVTIEFRGAPPPPPAPPPPSPPQ